MYYVYILLSKKDNQLYVGSTLDLRVRIARHQKGLVRATSYRQPLILIHYEAYFNSTDAKRREIYLKGGKGRRDLKIQLKECFREVEYVNR